MADRSTPRMDPWERYLHRPVSIRDAHDQNATFGVAFRSQRSAIAEIFSSLAATRVACLGSGYLSDIPVEEFAVAGADVHFVDWVPDVSLAGFQHKLFQASERPACWVCAQECPNPTDYCASYSPPPSPNPVCPAYRDAGLPFHACDSYVRGSQPSFDRADVTGGVASRFARKAGKLVRAARSPAQAFRQATRMVAELRARPSTLTLAEDSMDLVTSSMVISQFDKEPYRYFSGLLESKFGRDRINQNEVVLRSLMEELRSATFGALVEGHVAEMHRLTRKEGGRAYCSFELYRTLPDSSLSFQVQDMGKVIETLGRYFYFDFSLHPAEQALTPIEFGGGTSMVFAALMAPKPA